MMASTLFDDELRPTYRHTDPDTSADAAIGATSNAATHRQRAAQALLSAGRDGLTDFELADLTGIAQTSIGKRRGELVTAGVVTALLDRTGRQIRRPAPSGASAGVWVHVAHAPDTG